LARQTPGDMFKLAMQPAESVAPLLSVLVPVYNEAHTIREILVRVARVPVPKAVIVVDDASTDGTTEILRDLEASPQVLGQESGATRFGFEVIVHEKNRGKGAAIRTGLARVTGDMVIVQDADLEYDPSDYLKLIQPILDGKADVVYGSRFLGYPRRVLFFWHTVGNNILTLISNMLSNLNLTDVETGYKVFRTEVIKSVRLRCDRFGFEPEITAKIARGGWRIYEVPISYAGRTYAEGKKINWKDGVSALWTIIRFNLLTDGTDHAATTLRRVSRLSRYNTWLYEQISPFVGRRILEVGAGLGTMTRYLLDRDLVVASDINPRYLGALQATLGTRHNLVVQPFDLNGPVPEWVAKYSLDTVMCLNVLEHIEDDEAVLRRLYDALPRHGRVLLIVPAMRTLYGNIDEAIGHFRRYEPDELSAKLRRAGFVVEAARHFNFIGVPGWFLNGRLLRRKTVPGLQARLNDLLVPVLRLERHFRLPFGMSLLAVGRKG
jgi:glycosyltransferase involved in cell wall biosynthesis